MMMAAATADHEARVCRSVVLSIQYPLPLSLSGSLSLSLWFSLSLVLSLSLSGSLSLSPSLSLSLSPRGSPLGLGSHGTPGRTLEFLAVSFTVSDPSFLVRFP